MLDPDYFPLYVLGGGGSITRAPLPLLRALPKATRTSTIGSSGARTR